MKESIAIIIVSSEKDKARIWSKLDELLDGTVVAPLFTRKPSSGHARGDAHYSRTNPERLARGGKNGNVLVSKYSDGDIREIRRLYAAGVSQREIASRYKMKQANVSKIVLRHRWAHVQ